MVGYQQFVSLVFRVARERGRTIETLEDSQKYLQTAANLWSQNKQTLKSLSESDAHHWLEQNA